MDRPYNLSMDLPKDQKEMKPLNIMNYLKERILLLYKKDYLSWLFYMEKLDYQKCYGLNREMY